MSDWWPAIRVKRFSGEAAQAYARRKTEVAAIISGFRKGRFEGTMADKLDARLDALLSGDYDETRPDPFGVIGWEERPRSAIVRVVEAA
jgi:hypothetical protein